MKFKPPKKRETPAEQAMRAKVGELQRLDEEMNHLAERGRRALANLIDVRQQIPVLCARALELLDEQKAAVESAERN